MSILTRVYTMLQEERTSSNPSGFSPFNRMLFLDVGSNYMVLLDVFVIRVCCVFLFAFHIARTKLR